MSDFEDAVADKTAAPAPEGTTFEKAAETPAPQPDQVTTLSDGSIVVAGKVYKPEAAAKKIEHADTHIKTLEQENAEKDAATLELLERIEALEKSRNQKDALDELVAKAQPAAPIVPEQPPVQEVSKEELVQAAVDTIKGEQVAQQQTANLNSCIAQAQEVYGDDFGTKIDAAGARIGMTVDQVVDMARNQPKVFQQLFIPDMKPNGKPDTTGSTLAGDAGQGDAPPPRRKSILNMSAKDRASLVRAKMDALSNQG